MTTRCRNIVLATSTLLAALCVQAGGAHAAVAFTSRAGGFLTESDRRAPSAVDSGVAGPGNALCARASHNSPRRCPSAVNGAPGFPDKISAGLPHLRLNILLKEMKNVVVAGSGVDSLGLFQEPWATWKISSAAADVSIPAPAEPGFGLPVPPPGETFGEAPYANGLFQGIIHNGCLGPVPTFDLKLDSTVIRSSTSEVFGEVHLEDAVDSTGFYTWAYTLRATDEAGNVSDFKFSGDADAYCTTESGLSAGLVGGGEIAVETVKLATESLDSKAASGAEYITQEDIDRWRNHRRLTDKPGCISRSETAPQGLRSETAATFPPAAAVTSSSTYEVCHEYEMQVLVPGCDCLRLPSGSACGARC